MQAGWKRKRDFGYDRLVFLVGTSDEPVAKVQKRYGVTRGEVRYWRKKVVDPSFHSGTWGGVRTRKWTDEERWKLHYYIWEEARCHPTSCLENYRQVGLAKGFLASKMYYSHLFRSWQWSFARPSTTQWHKYQSDNILSYADFLLLIPTIPWGSLKYLDESHFIKVPLMWMRRPYPFLCYCRTPPNYKYRSNRRAAHCCWLVWA